MRKLIPLLLLCTFWSGLICKPLGAEPVINEVIRYYQIVGNTALDLRRQMNLKGPGGKNGEPFDAYTAWQVDWRYRWWETEANCRLTSVTTRVAITFTLPAWQNEATASVKLKHQWGRYIQALTQHEKGHRDFGVQAAREIERAMLNVGIRQTCPLLDRDADAAANAILDRYIMLEKQYDIRTEHGAKTGAIFP